MNAFRPNRIYNLLAALALWSAVSLRADHITIGISVEFEDPTLVKESVIAFRFLLGEALSDQNLLAALQAYPDFRAGLQALGERKIDATIVPGHAFAGLPPEQQSLFVPELVVQQHSVTTERFVVLSRHGTGLDALQGGSLRIVDRRNRGITRYWLEAELRAKGMSLQNFFSSVTDCMQSQEAVLPTFFGKADACLISEDDFKLLNELNPQLSQSLSVVFTSPPLMPLLLVRHRDNHSKALTVLVDRAVKVHEKPDGRQVFTLVRLSRLSRFREEDFAGTRELVIFAEKSSNPHS